MKRKEKKEYFGAKTITLRFLAEANSEEEANDLMIDCLNEVIGMNWYNGSLVVSDWDSWTTTETYELSSP